MANETLLEAPPGLPVSGWSRRPGWGVHAALLLTSAAILTMEIALTRFFSHTIWYHFAYLTISMALLGFGATGSIVAAFPQLLARLGQRFVAGSLLLAAACAVGGLFVMAGHPLQIGNLTTNPLQFSIGLLGYYVLVATPFLLSGFAISMPFAAWPGLMGRLYFWDLLGAALGCVLVGAFVEVVGVPGLVIAAAGLMIAAAAALLLASGRRAPGAVAAAVAVAVVLAAGAVGSRIPVLVTDSKTLATSVAVLETLTGKPFLEHDDRFGKWTAINRVDAFGWEHPSPYAFWSRIGMGSSWAGRTDKPQVATLTYDGSNGSDVYGFHGDLEREFEFLEHHQLRLPYLVLERPRVLVIGVGGGIDLFNAIRQGARHVTGVELQPETVGLLRGRLREFNGGFFHRDDVTLVAGEGRHFVRKTDEVFDLVQITAVDTFAAQSVGAYVLAESYLYTVEALVDYFDRLAPDGMVSMVVGDIYVPGQPVPLATRLSLIGFRALERLGVADPRRHIVVVGAVAEGDNAQNAVVLTRKTPFTEEQVERISTFAQQEGFRLLYAPGVEGGDLAGFLGTDEARRSAALAAADFDMEATHDDAPFFYNVAKWENFTPGKSIHFAMPGSFMGQLVLVMMVVQSTLLGLVLVLGPLLFGARGRVGGRGVASYLAYFLALGIGFMFIEISFVQSFVLFLGSPTYALSVTIFSLLLFSAVGSLASSRWAAVPELALRRLAPLLALIVLAYAFGLSRVFDAALHLDLGLRIAIAIVAQMPMGLVLGMFMPLGIAAISRVHPRLVPWAWGVNGVGSVTGTTLAVLLAMAAGFRTVAIVAVCLYLAGTALLLRATTAPGE